LHRAKINGQQISDAVTDSDTIWPDGSTLEIIVERPEKVE
jgi:hypothetical protein